MLYTLFVAVLIMVMVVAGLIALAARYILAGEEPGAQSRGKNRTGFSAHVDRCAKTLTVASVTYATLLTSLMFYLVVC